MLLDRCLDLLAPALDEPGAVVVDATLGLGGHAEGAAAGVHPSGWSASTATPRRWSTPRRLAPFGDGTGLVHAVYDELPTVLDASASTE